MKYLGLFGVLLTLWGCGGDKETVCDTYFLAEWWGVSSSIKFYYSDDGKLDVETVSGGPGEKRYRYVYDGNGRLKELIGTEGAGEWLRIYFYFNTDGQFVSAHKRIVDPILDPLYPDLAYTDSMAVLYQADGRIARIDHFNAQQALIKYEGYGYPESNIVLIDFYKVNSNAAEYSNSEEYTLDDKPLPFPKEHQYYWLASGYRALEHNEIKVRYEPSAHTNTKVLSYNSAGYIVSDNIDASYRYNCTPVREP